MDNVFLKKKKLEEETIKNLDNKTKINNHFSFFTYFFILLFVFLGIFSSSIDAYPVEIKWQVQTSQTSTPPVISSHYLFSISDNGDIVALNKLTGAKVWEASIGKRVLYQSLFSNNNLFVPAENMLFAISENGIIIGNITLNSTISSPILNVGSNIVFVTRDGTVYIMSYPQTTISSKNIIRTFKLDGEFDSSYTTYDNKIYLVTIGGKIYLVDPSGSSVLLYDLGYSVWRSKLVIANNTIYVPSEHSLYGVNLQGNLALVKRIADGNINSISTDGELLYFGSDDGYLYAVYLDGTFAWKFKTNNSIKSIPLILKESIVFSSRDNTVYSIRKNAQIQEQMKNIMNWNLTLSDWSSQIVEEGGVLYFTTYDGTIYAVSTLSCRITNPEANSSILPIVDMVGDAYAENGIKSVQVRTLPGEWQSVSVELKTDNSSVSTSSWTGRIQISGFSEGDIFLQCRVVDENNNEEISPYTTVGYNFVFSEDKLPKINISYPSQVNINQPIVLKFFSQEGTILTGLKVKIGNEIFQVTDKTGQFTYIPNSEGKLTIYVEKSGYQTRQLEINVTKPLIQPIYVVIIFVLGIAIVIYSSIRKGTWR